MSKTPNQPDMNKLTVAVLLDFDGKLLLQAAVDGVPTNKSWTTDPWDLISMTAVDGFSKENPAWVTFDNCSCGVPGCGGFSEREAYDEGDFLYVMNRFNPEELRWVFRKSEIVETIKTVLSRIEQFRNSGGVKSVYWDVGHYGFDGEVYQSLMDEDFRKLKKVILGL